MREELDAKLVAKYPKIFAQRYGSLMETNMCWGFSCDDGWYWLIDELCASLQWDTDHNKEPQIVTSQVKEKFGRLCFYTQGATDRQFGMIKMAEYLSSNICEECGSCPAKTRNAAWIKTLCDNCWANHV